MKTQPVQARIGIAGVFEFRDKDGNVLSTMAVNGSIPLAQTGMTVEEAQEFISNHAKEEDHGSHDRR